MKRILAILLGLMIFPISCFATWIGTNEPMMGEHTHPHSHQSQPQPDYSYQAGQAWGNALGNLFANKPSRGKIKRNHYAVKDYLFGKSKRFVVATIAPQGASIEDNSVLTQASYVLYDLLKDKYVVFPQPFVIDHYMQTHPETMNMPPQQVSNDVFRYVQTISDSIIFIRVKEFSEHRGVADVNMEIVVYPHYHPRAVFTYTESRYEVENATKEEVVVKILKKFADKFEDVFKDSQIQRYMSSFGLCPPLCHNLSPFSLYRFGISLCHFLG